MRISTSWIYSSGAAAISRKQTEMLRTQQQLSAGKRVLSPSDDPIAASNALTTEQARAITEQYARNQGVAQGTLQLAEATLAQVGELLQDARALSVTAGNGALGPSDRASLALELRGKVDTLVGLANSRDTGGGYLFSGYQEGVQPFAQTTSGVAYLGDQGRRTLQVGAQRLLEVSASGSDVFEGARAGNGTFTVTPPATNTGTAVADAGQVISPGALTGHDYRIVFNAGGTTYDIVDATAAATLQSNVTYVPGASIRFDGISVTVTGTPAAGDRFDLAASPRQSMFGALEDLASLLESSAAGGVTGAQYQTRLSGAMAEIDQQLDHLLGMRTQVGARLRELDALGAQAADTVLQHQQELSRLVDLDYAEAASRLALQQMSLEAAQQSYLRVTTQTLFNFL